MVAVIDASLEIVIEAFATVVETLEATNDGVMAADADDVDKLDAFTGPIELLIAPVETLLDATAAKVTVLTREL